MKRFAALMVISMLWISNALAADPVLKAWIPCLRALGYGASYESFLVLPTGNYSEALFIPESGKALTISSTRSTPQGDPQYVVAIPGTSKLVKISKTEYAFRFMTFNYAYNDEWNRDVSKPLTDDEAVNAVEKSLGIYRLREGTSLFLRDPLSYYAFQNTSFPGPRSEAFHRYRTALSSAYDSVAREQQRLSACDNVPNDTVRTIAHQESDRAEAELRVIDNYRRSDDSLDR